MLKPKEIAEISLALWYLPLDKVEEVRKLVMALKEHHGYKEPIDDSDEWTDEDREEATLESLRRWDAMEEGAEENDAETGGRSA